ncbi:hypothetical protein [Rhizobacter sp. Root1221]|uniref:hypothetical protein n=1 Tax=Rhizobacter sp. Root1221 TaxID=1736433 RepID=UPI0006F4948B|nr:hypothetical protein [Rhizobacter sp. Root1221]KQW02233.1 hypothetical protein ASC87_13465 [Rhizobacter sp. Root1221]
MNIILSFVRSFIAPTVESITAPLTKTVKRLEAHADREAQRSETQEEGAQLLLDASDKAAAESLRAQATAKRIKALVG